MNRRITLFAMMLFSVFAYSQKKKLTHQDYDQWESISSYAVSTNGNFVRYEINPQKGDGALYIYDSKTDEQHKFERGTGAKFSYDEGYVVFKVKPVYAETREAKRLEKKKDEMPKWHVVFVDLKTWESDTIKNAKSFKLPSEHEGWLAVKLDDASKKKKKKAKKEEEKTIGVGAKKEEKEKEKEEEGDKKKKEKKTPKNRVVVFDFAKTTVDTLNNVSEYVFSKKNSVLLYNISEKKNDSVKGVFTLYKGEVSLIDTAAKAFSNLVVDESGSRLVWMSTQDSAKAEVKKYALNYVEGGKRVSLSEGYDGIPENFMVSNFYKPKFTEDGSQLFVEMRKIPEEVEKDTMELKEEKVSLDIWSWTDTVVQPAQKIRLKQTQEQGLKAVYHTTNGKLVKLENGYYESVRFDLDNPREWLMLEDNSKTYKSLSWDYPIAGDYYVVNAKTGERKLMAGGLKGNGNISPGGKYFYGFDKVSKEWFAVSIENGNRIKLNNFKDPVWNVENDVPALPGSYGIAGWAENDEAIFINTQFNIWKVDLADPADPTELISQEKDNPIRYRYQPLEYDEVYVSKVMTLLAFEENTKKEGYVSVNQDGSEFKTIFELENTHYSGFMKARKNDALIVRKGDFVNYPEVHYSPNMQSQPKMISKTNPQQSEYNWGTIELVSWKGKGGVGELDGLLVKPENFDPNKEYPVVIYFYERYSDLLNYHFGFKPSASTINFAYFASNEYIVFIPDVVYKTGYPGKSAYNCIVSGAEWLAKKPYVDAERMAIQGQSWGGYQVAYLVTQTDMFACAMAGAPVSNMTSAYGGIRWGSGWSREFQYEKTQSRLGGTLWDSRDLYIENSPVFYADKVNTPLLMMHNDNDGAVPWYQGIEYFMALRRLNKPTWMLVYNKEAHNLRKRHNKLDLSIRMSQFFDYYLQGAEAPEWMQVGRSAVTKETNKAY